MARCDCCGCVIQSDYGTSIVTGSGTASDPYTISMAEVPYVRPAARVRRTTNQLISIGNFDTVEFDTEIFDTDSIWDISNPSAFTINTAGLYVFGACAKWAAAAAGTRELSFFLNNTTLLLSNDQPPDSTNGATTTPWQHITYQYRFSVGDSLELLARQSSAGTLNLTAEPDDSIVFWIFYAGRVI